MRCCVIACVMFLSFACTADEVHGTRRAIVEGVDDVLPSEQARRDATVAVFGRSGGCTGTLITPRLVVTALHCVGASGTNAVSFGVEGLATFSFVLQDQGCLAPPGFACGWPVDDSGVDYNVTPDIALLILPERVELDGATANFPAEPARVIFDDPPGGPSKWVGETLTVVGYGDIDPDWSAPAVIPPFRQVAEREVVAAFTDRIQIEGPTTLMGDSGGPSYLISSDGTRFLLGIHSFNDRDVRTTAPVVRDWLEALFYGYAGHVYLGDRDVPVAGDPGRTPNDDVVDPDGDGLVGAHDNCPAVANPLQKNTDRDILGDVCDSCPDAYETTFSDPDGDGFNNDSCDTCDVFNTDLSDVDGDGILDACDSCPTTFDLPGAPNCNADAELSEGRPLVPDACDPVPCPEAAPANTVAPSGVPALPELVSNSDIITFGVKELGNQQVYRSGYRFCECPDASSDDPVARADCATSLESACVVDAEEYDNEFGVWRDLTLSNLGVTSCLPGRTSSDLECENDFARRRRSQTPSSLDWDFLGDAGRYSWPVSSVVGGSQIKGVLWSHSFEGVEQCTPLVGCSPLSLSTTDRRVASHYFSGDFYEAPVARSPAEPTIVLPPIFMEIPACIFCEATEFMGWLAAPPCFREGTCGLGDASARFPTFDAPADAVTDAATLLAMPDLLFLTPSDWRTSNAPVGTPAFFALQDDFTDVVGSLTDVGGFLTETMLPPSAGSPPTSRTGALAIYRQRDATLFVLGGHDNKGKRIGDVLRYDASLHEWSPVPIALAPDRFLGDVLAGASHPVRETLFAFAETAKLDGSGAAIDLLEIAMDGTVTVHASFGSQIDWPRHSMFFGDHGELYLMGASDTSALIVRALPSNFGVVDGGITIPQGVASDAVFDRARISYLTRGSNDALIATGIHERDVDATGVVAFDDVL